MSAAENGEKPAGISDAAVKARTGKTWSEWFSILDHADGVKLGHRGIVAYLDENFRVGPWWRQMLTVAYEQERGLREKHQTPEGFQVSASRTVAARVSALFDAWSSEDTRTTWLGSVDLNVRRSTPGRSIRITWADGKSTLDVNFYPKGPEKSQVVVEHKRLANADEAARMKEFWSGALERLKELLES
jgi:uncharacterized protein YndB with AHSA1/START domain